MTVYSVSNVQVGNADPYVTLTEVKNSATAAAIDFTNLVSSGAQAAQDIALSELISRASSKADSFCFGKSGGTLNATTNTETNRVRMNRWGQFNIRPTFTPIRAVSAFSWGMDPSCSNSVSLTNYNCQVDTETFTITAQGSSGSQAYAGAGINVLSALMQNAPGLTPFVQYTWTAGWANTFTSSVAASGSNSVSVVDPTGIYPGMQLTVWDGVNDEVMYVANTYVPGTSAVTFSDNFQNTHGTGVNVSALPATVKQAVIHLIVAMVKQRGQGGLILQELGEGEVISAKAETSAEDELAAYDLLEDFKSIWGKR